MENVFKSFFLLLHLILIQFGAIAGEVIVEGEIGNGKGKPVQLIAYADHISGLETVLGATTIGQDGYFKLDVDVDDVRLAIIEIGLQRGEFYIMPGHHYTINLNVPPDTYHFNFSQTDNLALIIKDSEAPDLNQLIQEFNILYNQLMLEQFKDAYSRINRQKVANLTDSINSVYQNIDQPYFKAYLQYRLALLELSSRVKSRESMAVEYFVGRPILYNNVEYMEFFNQFFSQFLITSSKTISSSELKAFVNEGTNYFALDEALQRFPYLSEKQFREVALLKGLKDLYHAGGFDRKQILMFFKQIARESGFPENKAIAENIIILLTRFARGSEAPDLILQGVDKQSQHLSDLPSSPTYIIFYNSKNLSCIAELDMLKTIKDDYKGKVHFVSVSLDESFETMARVKQERGYEWTFLYGGNDQEIIGKYKITRLPKCVMLDSQRAFINYIAPAPSENLAGYLYRVLE